MQAQVLASSVAPMDAKALADLAGQVITGTIVSVDPFWAANPRRIETSITLQDVEYLKGPSFDTSGTFTFLVPGGTVGRTGMQLCCAPTFQIGERWMLFLLPTYKTFPVVGVYRGSFRILQDADGNERVYDDAHVPILGLDNETQIMVAVSAANRSPRSPVELGVRLKKTGTPTPRSSRAITYQDFRAMLMPILEHSKDHQLTHPAGRREPAQVTSTSLKSAVYHRDKTDAGVEECPHHRRPAIPDKATRSGGRQRVRKR